MSKKSEERKVIVVADKDSEPFSRSNCSCNVCEEMNKVGDSDPSRPPETFVEKRLLKVIHKTQEREKKKKKKE